MQLYTILAVATLASSDSVFKGTRMWQNSNLKPLKGLNLKLKKPKNIPVPIPVPYVENYIIYMNLFF